MIDMNEKQAQINELQKHFDSMSRKLDDRDMRLIKCALGMSEESGELAHVVLKSITGHYGFDNRNKVKDKITDAVVDAFVFGLQVLNEIGVSFEEVFPKILDEVVDRNRKGIPHIPIQK